MPIRAVISDLFDVLLIEGDTSLCRAYEQQMNLPEGGLLQEMFLSHYFRQAVAGRLSGEELWRDVAKRIGEPPENWSMLVNLHRSMFILNTDLLAFFRSLRPRNKTAILSNASSEVRAWITEAFHKITKCNFSPKNYRAFCALPARYFHFLVEHTKIFEKNTMKKLLATQNQYFEIPHATRIGKY